MTAWAGRRVAVLGAAGFLGAHVVRRLSTLGAAVVACSRTPIACDLAVDRFVVGDVLDPRIVREAVAGCDVVFAMAGLSGAVASVRQPQRFLDANVGGLATLLDAVASAPSRARIVFPGSRLSYGSVAALPVAEDHVRRPSSPYGLYKTFCEDLLALYARRYGITYAVARITNPYGPGAERSDLPYNVLASLAARAVRGEPLTIYGDGSQLRDYLYIDDTVDALLLLAQAPDAESVVNVGSGLGVAFVDAVGRIAAATGATVVHQPWPEADRSVETGDFVADIARLRKLGFTPNVPFDDGLSRMIHAFAEEPR